MAELDVLKEILDWSKSRPPWQRDGLRRLVSNGELSEEDLCDLAEICKGSFGLVEKRSAAALEAKHIPEREASMKPIQLRSLTHHDGVNALGKDQTIEFGPSLTVVYGANAAGKSGYTRILKQACRARGAEDILGNVVSGAAPGRPTATIQFDLDGHPKDILWDDDQESDPALGRISVFDRHCASVYVAEKTDVAFRPFGLDIFDKLSDACEAVRKTLERERKNLASPTEPIVPNVLEGTEVHKLVSHITSLTESEAVKQLATLSEEDITELEDLRKRLRDSHADDPGKTAKVLDLRAKQTDSLVTHIATVLKSLADDIIQETFDLRDKMIESGKLAEQMRSDTFGEQPLPHTGSQKWRELWAAAERYSLGEAYPNQPFPVTDGDARCVLCQQELGVEATERLKAFREFLASAVQQEHDTDAGAYRQHEQRLRNLVISSDESGLAIEALKVEDSDLADAAALFLKTAEERRDMIMSAIDDEMPCPTELPITAMESAVLASNVKSMRDRASDLRKGTDTEAKAQLKLKVAELEAREQLGKHVDTVLDEVTRQKKIAAYQLCLEETKTTGITRKSSDVTERAVTKQLATSFADELKSLKFQHVEVDLISAGGARGSLFHKLSLKRAPGVSVPKVVSEGEARCLSIASFFAELSTTADLSAILFDDPVSSLDHNWREHVAHRLVSESQSRQVIVFTHDIVFLLSLIAHADKLSIDVKNQYLRRDKTGAGIAAKQLPWPAMKVKNRIGHLKDMYQQAEKQHRTGNQSVYETLVSTIYGLLRESWERAIEEVLLGGVVERYRNSVQTQQAGNLSDISPADCNTLEEGMTKCSRWLPGHDQAPAENPPFPEPSELEGDIQALQDWVDDIRRRRK